MVADPARLGASCRWARHDRDFGHVVSAARIAAHCRMTQAVSGERGCAQRARYAYKASLIGAAHQFELTDEGLSWQVGGKSGVWPYADIARISLSYRPVSMQSRRFRADIENANGQRIVILSTSWQTVALMAPQDHDYRAFITQLHERMEKAGSKAALIGGISPESMPPASCCWRWSRSRYRGFWFARSPPANWRARCFWSVLPHCLPGRSAALSGVTGRGPTPSIICRRRCCRSRASG